MPHAPTGITPAGPITVTTGNIFNWLITLPPLQYEITIDAAYCQSGSDYDATEPGSSTLHLLPANTLKTGQTGVVLEIGATNVSTIAGAGSGSTFGTVNLVEHTFDTN